MTCPMNPNEIYTEYIQYHPDTISFDKRTGVWKRKLFTQTIWYQVDIPKQMAVFIRIEN